MTVDDCLKAMRADHRLLAERLLAIIDAHDPVPTRTVLTTMGTTMIGYTQEGDFKYGIASHAGHLSVHSMVMYCYPELREAYRPRLRPARVQKGCINIADAATFPFDIFTAFIEEGARYPYPSDLHRSRKRS